MTERKIIQIVALVETRATSTPFRSARIDVSSVYSLCDDGTAWKLKTNRWKQLPPIPPDTVEAE